LWHKGATIVAWEARGNRRYYYRSKRHGNRVCKIYFGCGPAAELAARHDAERRAQREAEKVQLADLQAHLASLDEITEGLQHGTDLLAAAVLMTEG
jgi:hypothetical protein